MNINHPKKEDIPALRQLWREAFGDTDEYLDTFFANAFDFGRCLCIDGGKAACYWFPCACRGRKIAYLYAVATAKDSRGRGLCRALLTQAQRVLATQGFDGILLVPQKESLRPMYRKLGFREATTLREFSTTAPLPSPGERWLAEGESDEGTPLHIIPPAVYAQARQSLLPEGAALEGPEFFTFLATQLSFCRFGDTLFACAREDDHLFIPEYLGSPDQLPQLLAALGCTHATVRTPGTGTKWAMYCPLSNAPAPTHFSFAMD